MNSIKFLFLFIPILSVILITINLLLAPHAPYKEKKTPFECGYHSFLLQNRSQFSISFFAFGLLFLLFDLEIVLIYPMGLSIEDMEIHSILLAFIFIAILTVGFVFELGKGALKIESKQNAPAPYTDLQMLKSKSCNNIFSAVNNDYQLYPSLAQELNKDKVLTNNYLPCDKEVNVDSYDSVLSKTHVFDMYKNFQLKFDRMSHDINTNIFNKYTITDTYDKESVFFSLNKINTQIGELTTLVSILNNYTPLMLPLLLSIITILVTCFISLIDLLKGKTKFMKINKFICLFTALFILLMLFTILLNHKPSEFSYHVRVCTDLYKILDIFAIPCCSLSDIPILSFADNIASSSDIKGTYNQISASETTSRSDPSTSIATNIGSGSGSGEDPDDNKRPKQIDPYHYIDEDAMNIRKRRMILIDIAHNHSGPPPAPKTSLDINWLRYEIKTHGLSNFRLADVKVPSTTMRVAELLYQESVNLSEFQDLFLRFSRQLAVGFFGTLDPRDTFPRTYESFTTLFRDADAIRRIVIQGGVAENYHIMRAQINEMEILMDSVERFVTNSEAAASTVLSEDDIGVFRRDSVIRLRLLISEIGEFMNYFRNYLDFLERLQVEIQTELRTKNIPPYSYKKP